MILFFLINKKKQPISNGHIALKIGKKLESAGRSKETGWKINFDKI
ncbi:MAG: hypothetical protein CM15mP16_06100 [Candidatus Pelagibacterales bacterium]|nr:MAG: hypothetical protein CM15mP16_06100 [Pelagibacterales bacterium]